MMIPILLQDHGGETWGLSSAYVTVDGRIMDVDSFLAHIDSTYAIVDARLVWLLCVGMYVIHPASSQTACIVSGHCQAAIQRIPHQH